MQDEVAPVSTRKWSGLSIPSIRIGINGGDDKLDLLIESSPEQNVAFSKHGIKDSLMSDASRPWRQLDVTWSSFSLGVLAEEDLRCFFCKCNMSL